MKSSYDQMIQDQINRIRIHRQFAEADAAHRTIHGEDQPSRYLRQLAEECMELGQACLHADRKDREEDREAILEEIADVVLSIEAVCRVTGISKEDYYHALLRKLGKWQSGMAEETARSVDEENAWVVNAVPKTGASALMLQEGNEEPS